MQAVDFCGSFMTNESGSSRPISLAISTMRSKESSLTLAIETGLRILGIVPDKILTGSIFSCSFFLKVPAINGIKFFPPGWILERIKKQIPGISKYLKTEKHFTRIRFPVQSCRVFPMATKRSPFYRKTRKYKERKKLWNTKWPFPDTSALFLAHTGPQGKPAFTDDLSNPPVRRAKSPARRVAA